MLISVVACLIKKNVNVAFYLAVVIFNSLITAWEMPRLYCSYVPDENISHCPEVSHLAKPHQQSPNFKG